VAALHPKLQEAGYKDCINEVKALLPPYKRPKVEPVARFERLRGQQAQADFNAIRRGRAPFPVPVGMPGFSTRKRN
jgi:hypothetical protein